ncbi:hypothetical protein PLESTF_001900300, partial [Pleodorina starrii]
GAPEDPPRRRPRAGRTVAEGAGAATRGGRTAEGAADSGGQAQEQPPLPGAGAAGAEADPPAQTAALVAMLRAALTVAQAGHAQNPPAPAGGTAADADARAEGLAEAGAGRAGPSAALPPVAEEGLAGAALAAETGALAAGRAASQAGLGAMEEEEAARDAALRAAGQRAEVNEDPQPTPREGYPAGLYASPGVASPLRQHRRPNTPGLVPTQGQRPASRLAGATATSGHQPAAQRGLFGRNAEPEGVGVMSQPQPPPQLAWPHVMASLLGAAGNPAAGPQSAAEFAAIMAAAAAILGGDRAAAGVPGAGGPAGAGRIPTEGATDCRQALPDPFAAAAARTPVAGNYGLQPAPSWLGGGDQATELPDGRILLGGALLSAPRLDSLGQTTHEVLDMPPLVQLRAPRHGLGGNETHLAVQAARLEVTRNELLLTGLKPQAEGPSHTQPLAEAIVGGVVLTLGAAAALTTVTQAVLSVLKAAAIQQADRLKTALGGPLGDQFAERVLAVVRTELKPQLEEISDYAATYGASVRTVAQKVAAFLGGIHLAEKVLHALRPGQPDLSREQDNWLSAAAGLIRKGQIFDKPMTLAMWKEGFGPQLGCLQRIADALEEAERLLNKHHLAAAYNAGGSGGGRGVGAHRQQAPRGGPNGGGGSQQGASAGGGGGAAPRATQTQAALAALQRELAQRNLPLALCPDERAFFRLVRGKLKRFCVNKSLLGKECSVTPCHYTHDTPDELAARLAKLLEDEHPRQQAGAK